MTGTNEARLQTLEGRTAWLAGRLEALEAHVATPDSVSRAAPRMPAPAPAGWPAPAGAPAPLPSAGAPALAATGTPASRPSAAVVAEGPLGVPAPPPRPRAPRPTLEDLLGGRVLAWTGGLAVLLGVVFLLAIAVSNGWIGEGARTLMAGLVSLALIGTGIWLQEHRRRTDAALATVAAGIAALFTTVAVGGPVYGVLPVPAALAIALATGAVATFFAIRWEARGIGALGIIGALCAPILAGAPSEPATLALLWVAGLSGAAVVVRQRWDWLGFAIFAVAAPQWAAGLAQSPTPSPAEILLVLTAFGALNVGAAIGFELRVPTTRLRPTSALLLTLNAIAIGLAGYFALDGALAEIWIGALAVAHLVVGLAFAATRVARDIRLLSLVLGIVLADIALALILDGPVRALAWAAGTAGFALLARNVLEDRDEQDRAKDEGLLGIGLGGHMLLAAGQALVLAPPGALASGDGFSTAGYVAIAAVSCSALVAGRFTDHVRREWRVALDAVALAGAAYLTAVALDGTLLVTVLAAEAVLLGWIALRGRDAVAAWGGGAYLALALARVLLQDAPPTALVTGLDDVAAAALTLAAVAVAALRGAHLAGRGARTAGEDDAPRLELARTVLGATGALALLYLASAAIVTPFQPGYDASFAAVDIGARQLGQSLLSGLWAITGLAALVVGLRRDDRVLRLGALALLLVTIGKVFLYDLAALTSLYRVASFIALGLLLLVAAGIWQRMRPRPLPDLRATPPALR